MRAVPFTTTVTPITPGEVLTTLLTAGLTLVTFRKRGDGTIRTMLCMAMSQVKGDASYAPLSKGLLRVWDVEKEAPRMIPMEAVVSARKLDPFATASAALAVYAA